MKEYKVGDTIYVKGTVADVDNNDPVKPYGVNFVKKSYCVQAWPNRLAIIDELPTAEPVKPVLPKEVADELEYAKECKDSFDVYIMRIINSHPTYENSRVFWSNSSDGVIKTLMGAWNNGYTVEEKIYNVKVPHTKDGWYYRSWNSDLRPVQGKEICSEFTESDIEHYGLQDCEKEEVKQ